MNQRQKIVDEVPFTFGEILQESTPGPEGRPMLVKGIFAMCDEVNLNRRRYRKNVWEGALQRAQERIAARAMLGEVDHPDDGQTRLERGSHIITKAEVHSDGSVRGVIELLNTPGGLILQEYARKRVRIGVSSRGEGSVEVVESEDSGARFDDVQEDFELETWDFVYRPSVTRALPTLVHESAGGAGAKGDRMETAATPEKRFRAIREDANRILRRPLALLTQEDREAAIVESERLTCELDRIAEDDAGCRTLATELSAKLAEKRDQLASPSAPPPPDRQIKAAEALVAELTRKLQTQEKAHRETLGRLQTSFETRLRATEAKNAAIGKQLRASLLAGQEVLSRYEGSRVREHVINLLSQAANAALRPMREQLLQSKTVDEVDRQLEGLRRILRPKSSAREGLPPGSAQATPRRVLAAEAVESHTPSSVPDQVVETATDLRGRLGLKY